MDDNLRIKKRRLLRDFSIIGVSIVIAIYIQSSSLSGVIINWFSTLYFVPAAILMGFLFSLTFTAAISTSVFILLADTSHNPYLIALLGGVGSVIANSLIYKFFNKEIMDDIELLEPRSAKKLAHKIMHSKLFVGAIPFIAAMVFMSPLPDEIGVMFLSGSNLRYTRFFLLSFALHAIGILLILLFGKSLT